MNKSVKKESQSETYLRLINDMLTDKTFNSVTDFLKSVRDQIKNTNNITDKQIKTVNNIYIKFSKNL